ncbi:MAG: NUDIX domain-containing protein [Desulfuromonadales bacterium]|nr:NUDIX domain-containing protein [Desulfuromonadales bacterium]MBN2790978.1 NUDIX domain-containing protein [Desulfuromonadales bacterium]
MPFKITDFSIATLADNKFIRPVRLHYVQNGTRRSWEAVKSHDSVSVLLYHTEKKAFLLVKQFRPAVHLHHPQHTYTYELCAGIVDKEKSLEQITREEIDEECGYDVPVDRIEKVSSFFTNVGVTGSRQHLYYATIDETMRVHAGGGTKNEEIILEFLPLSQAREFLFNEDLAKTPGLMFAFYWFFEQITNPAVDNSIDGLSSPAHQSPVTPVRQPSQGE